jgi:dolichol-phosphate mannosyltransferase
VAKTLIFIPTYNEGDNVGPMCKELDALGLDADLVVLDDNSPDGTGALLDELSRIYPRLRVIHRTGVRGIGSAHLDGIAYAYDHGYDKLVTLDCDFTHSPRDIPMMLERSAGAEVTVASRYLEQDSLPGWSVFRKSLTRLGHFLTENLLGIGNDATGAFRVYDLRRIPRGIFELVTAHGYAFFFQSLFILHQNGLGILDVPIRLPARTYGHSKMSLREVQRSVGQLVSLYAATKTNPAQFVLPKPVGQVDPTLVDTQGWDEYWDKKSEKKALAYETIAAIYRNLVIRRRLEHAMRREFARGARLLHAGCGSGQVDVGLHDHLSITAVDISLSALRLYAQENPHAHEVRHASIFALPFEDGVFDGAYNLGVVEHFSREELARIFAELHRVIRPGGKLLLFWPHAYATSVRVLDSIHWVLNDVLQKEVRLHPHEVSLVHSKNEAREILEPAGFQLCSYDFGPKDFWVQAIVVADRK